MADGASPSRIVFVSVAGREGDQAYPRTRRKRALGVADNATFGDFLQLCCARLQLRGIQSIKHATTGKEVRGMDDLQDIEDLLVEETPADDARAAATAVYLADRSLLEAAPAPALEGGGAAPYAPGSAAKRAGSGRFGAAGGGDEHRMNFGAAGGDGFDDDDSGDAKYARRAPWHRQLLQHVGFPSFTGTECLPVTNPQLAVDAASKKDGPGPHAAAAAKRGARTPSTCTPARAFVACSLATCVATMVLLYSRLSQA